jgi:phosphatidylglycerol:prolipoprotein diacylglycerol transferase
VTVYPILLEFGGVRLHSYGLVVAAAMLIGLWVAGREATRKGLDAEFMSNLGLVVILAGVLGARLAYVVGWEPELFWRDPAGVFAVWRGGLALHGGLLAGVAAGVWRCLRRRVNPWTVADAVAPALAVGQGIGRLACFLSGDAYGTPTALPWAIVFTSPHALAPLNVPLHPTQLYEFGLDLALFGLLWAYRKRIDVDGGLFLTYALGYGVIRLLTETVRGDRVELGGGLSLLQAVSLALVVSAAVAFLWRATARASVVPARRGGR